MKSRIFGVLAVIIGLSSCSTAYRQGQTPDDVYFSPAKERTYASAGNNTQRYNNNGPRNNQEYEEYTSSSDDRYLRMKIQNRYRWNSLDDYDYWYNPGFAFNNFYGYNNFNPLLFNSWGLNAYYSPFASIRPFGWFNNFYPTYGFFTPYNGYFGHNYGYSYMPVFTNNLRSVNTAGTHRPLLGGYVNNNYNNSNNRSRTTGRYVPAFNADGSRYNNRNNNNNSFNNNNNSFNRSNNSNNAPVRTFTPSGGGSTGGSSSGGGVTRQPR